MITVSLSLSILMLIRGASPTGATSCEVFLGAYQSTSGRLPEFFNARDMRIRFSLDATIDLNIKDSDDSNGLIVFSKNAVDSTTEVNVRLSRRGYYYFELYNPNNSTQDIHMLLSEYNFETDLMQGAIVFSIIGVSLIIVEKSRGRIKHSLQQGEQRKT